MIKDCTTESDFQQVLEASKSKAVFLFKHSTTCPISRGAWDTFTDFAAGERRPDYWRVLARENKELAETIAVSTDIRHETPQVILFYEGKAVWKCSHRSITGENLSRHLNRLGI